MIKRCLTLAMLLAAGCTGGRLAESVAVFGDRPAVASPIADGNRVARHQLLSRYVRDEAVWRTPPIRPQGFQFEIQLPAPTASYDLDLVWQSIRKHNLGEDVSAVSEVMAAEWGYSFTHLDGQTDGAGRRIKAGYPSPPADRAECLTVIASFLHQQYIRGAPHPWASMNGHFPWHHYAAEFGFDQIGSEIGENINNYQWHIALTRGAARQYARPWFIDFSAWHGPSVTDYSTTKIWPEYSGPDHGHSMSLFERSLFMSYMAGAGQITAEAGGAFSFLPSLDDQGRYQLSPYGEVCKRFRDFTLAHPDIGVPLTPFAVVLDYHHGAYPGFGKRRAFWHFDYTAGDNMTWDLINLIWPGGWEVMGKNEVGTMVNAPFGDIFDILLQNAPQKALGSYPCLILSGDIRLSAGEITRYNRYVQQGGTLILNSAYLRDFPKFRAAPSGGAHGCISIGNGRVIVYGPDYRIEEADDIIKELMPSVLPVSVSSNVQYLVNVGPGRVFVTLINNEGITKEPRQRAVVDSSKTRTVVVSYRGGHSVVSVTDLKENRDCKLENGNQVAVTLQPGQLAILEFKLK